MSRHFASTDAQSYMRTLERRVGQLERRGRNMSAISSSLHAGRLGDALPDCVTMITPSDTPPPDPVGDACDIWIDTSANPPIPRMWDGEDWLKITDQDLLDALRRITHPIGIDDSEEMPPYDPNRRVGALWRDPKTGILYYWDGNKWVQVTVGDPGPGKKLREDLEEARQEIADTGAELDERLRQAEQDLEAARGRIDDAEDRLGAAEAELEAAAIWIAETGAELSVRLAQAEQDLSDAEDRLEAAETRLGAAEAEIDAASTWIDETGAQLGANLAQAQQDIDAAEVRLEGAETRLTTAEGEIAAASSWIADTGAQLGTNLAAAQDMLDAAFPTGVFDVGEAIDAIVAGAGGNVITYSNITEANKPGPAPTSTEGRKSGDIHRNRNQNTYEIYAEWMLGTSGTWQPVNFGDSILRSLDVGKITGGSAAFLDFVSQNLTSNEAVINELWTEVVRSRKITTDMLIVGSGENMIADPSFSDDELLDRRLAAVPVYAPFLSATTGGAVPGAARRIRISGASTGAVAVYLGTGESGFASRGGEFPVKAGGQYRFWADVRRNGDAQWRWVGNITRTDGSTSQITLGQPWQGGAAGGVEHVWTVPNDVTHVTPLIQRHSTNQGGVLDIAVPTMMIDGASLIVDGSISAKHINVTGELTAEIADIIELNVDRLVSTNATMKTGVIEQLWADVVRSRKITTDMLVVGSGENRIVDPYFDSAELRALRGAQTNVLGPWGRSSSNNRRLIGGGGQPGTSQTFYFIAGEGGIGSDAQFTDVAAGDTFRIQYTINVTGNVRPYFRAKYADGTTAGVVFGPSPWVTYTTGIRDIEHTFTIPEGVVGIIPALHFNLATAIHIYGGASLVRMSDSSLIVDGAITAKKITITGDENNPDEAGLVANIASIMELDVGNLVALKGTIDEGVINELWTKVVRSQKITTDMLLVGNGVNIIPNGNLALGNEGWDRLTAPGINVNNALVIGYPASMWREGTGNIQSRDFDVEGGKTYRLVMWARADRAGKRFYVQIRNNGTGGNPYPMSNVLSSTDWVRYEATVDMPADATTAYFDIYPNHQNGTTQAGYQWFTGFHMTEDIASLIVDGGITAKQITITGDPNNPDEVGLVANMASILHLTAENLYVPGTATVEEGIINTLWTQVVRSRKITTDMLLVGQGENLIRDPYLADPEVNAEREIGAGWTVVDTSQGKVISQNAWTNGATELQGTTEWIPVASGEEYQLTWDQRGVSGAPSIQPTIRYRRMDGSLSYVTWPGSSAHTHAGVAYQRQAETITIPTNVKDVRVLLRANAAGTGVAYVKNPHFGRNIGSLIVDGTIKARHVDAESIAADIGEFVYVEAEHIKSGVMEATLTLSGRIQTATSGQRVIIDESGILYVNAFNTTLFGATPAGVKVVGTIQTGLFGSGVTLKPDGSKAGDGIIEFTDGGTSVAFIALDYGAFQDARRLVLQGPKRTGTAAGEVWLSDDGVVQVEGWLIAPRVYSGTSTGTANVRVATNGGLSRATSLAAYKEMIEPLADWQGVKALEPVTYYDKDNLEQYSSALWAKDEDALEAVEHLTKWIGLTAEQAEESGSGLATYDSHGRLNGVAYDRLAVALLPWLHELERRINNLEENDNE